MSVLWGAGSKPRARMPKKGGNNRYLIEFWVPGALWGLFGGLGCGAASLPLQRFGGAGKVLC